MGLTQAAQRFADAALALGIAVEIVERAEPTRTAEEAAAACGCSVAEIVKSLVFERVEANRVDEAAIASRVGGAIRRPNAATVREVTGFAIGGIPPFGHARPLETFIDRDLMRFETVWAAAGTPNAVFRVPTSRLAAIARAEIVDVA
jgi:prolyl-tRNA editing enzyme YbaK/EbsC (Cys-tRNA(Pro) deacylase)